MSQPNPVEERIASALERIATALEARNTASRPIPVVYDATDQFKSKTMVEINNDGFVCSCGALIPFGQSHQCP